MKAAIILHQQIQYRSFGWSDYFGRTNGSKLSVIYLFSIFGVVRNDFFWDEYLKQSSHRTPGLNVNNIGTKFLSACYSNLWCITSQAYKNSNSVKMLFEIIDGWIFFWNAVLGEMFKTARPPMLNRIKQVLSSIQISKIDVHAIVTKISRSLMYFSQQIVKPVSFTMQHSYNTVPLMEIRNANNCQIKISKMLGFL